MKDVKLKVNVTGNIQNVADALGLKLPEKFTLIREVTYQEWPESVPELVEKFGDAWLVERVPSFWAYHVGHGGVRADSEKKLVELLGLASIKKDEDGLYPESVREQCAAVFEAAVKSLESPLAILITAPVTGPTEKQLEAAKASLARKTEMEEAGRELMAALAANDPVALASATKKLERLRRIQTPEAEAETPEPEAEPAPAQKKSKKSVDA